MPKRGERAIERVRFAWTDGPHGVIPCYYTGMAEIKAAEIRRNAELADRQVEVVIETFDGRTWMERS